MRYIRRIINSSLRWRSRWIIKSKSAKMRKEVIVLAINRRPKLLVDIEPCPRPSSLPLVIIEVLNVRMPPMALKSPSRQTNSQHLSLTAWNCRQFSGGEQKTDIHISGLPLRQVHCVHGSVPSGKYLSPCFTISPLWSKHISVADIWPDERNKGLINIMINLNAFSLI